MSRRSFALTQPDACVAGLEKLPAIIWKRRNLETLRRRDAKKFADNAMTLEKMLL